MLQHHEDPDEVGNGIVRGELLDAIIEVIVQARGPAARAAVISELVQEMWATVEWLHDTDAERDDSEPDELVSIMRLPVAARDHQRQMSAARRLAPSVTVRKAVPLRSLLPAQPNHPPEVDSAPSESSAGHSIASTRRQAVRPTPRP